MLFWFIPGPRITTVAWCYRKNLSQWECSFHWKLHSHWLKFLWQHDIAVATEPWNLYHHFKNLVNGCSSHLPESNRIHNQLALTHEICICRCFGIYLHQITIRHNVDLSRWLKRSYPNEHIHGLLPHYSDIIMSMTASQITGIPIVYSFIC